MHAFDAATNYIVCMHEYVAALALTFATYANRVLHFGASIVVVVVVFAVCLHAAIFQLISIALSARRHNDVM